MLGTHTDGTFFIIQCPIHIIFAIFGFANDSLRTFHNSSLHEIWLSNCNPMITSTIVNQSNMFWNNRRRTERCTCSLPLHREDNKNNEMHIWHVIVCPGTCFHYTDSRLLLTWIKPRPLNYNQSTLNEIAILKSQIYCSAMFI